MSALTTNKVWRDNVLGPRVNRAAAALPQTATGTIFTITGGQVLVTSLIGTVTVATGATATTLKIVSTPTVGTAADLTTAVSVASKEVGTIIALNVAVGGALTVATAGGAAIPAPGQLVLNAGTIQLTTSASNTGSVKWSITYVPLDDGASISAA